MDLEEFRKDRYGSSEAAVFFTVRVGERESLTGNTRSQDPGLSFN